MSTDLTAPGLPPALFGDEGIDKMIEGFVATIEVRKDIDHLRRLPTPAERQAIERRRQELHMLTRPISMAMAEQETAMRALGELFRGYPSLRTADAAKMCSAYLSDLEGFPIFAFLQTIDDVKRNRIKTLDENWPPSTPALYKVCERHTADVVAKRCAAERVLKITVALPPPPTAAEETKIKESLSGFAQRLREKLDDEREDRRQELHAKIFKTAKGAPHPSIEREYAKLGMDPIQTGGLVISAELADKLGALPPKVAVERRRARREKR